MSDQDFFFDEDETTVAEAAKPASKSAGKAAPARSGAAKAAPTAKAAPAPAGGSQVSMTVAALMTVVGLLLGVIIGFILPGGGSSTTVAPTAPAAMGGSSTAPQLSEDQLKSGQMPEGHPPVESMGGSAETSETTATGQ